MLRARSSRPAKEIWGWKLQPQRVQIGWSSLRGVGRCSGVRDDGDLCWLPLSELWHPRLPCLPARRRDGLLEQRACGSIRSRPLGHASIIRVVNKGASIRVIAQSPWDTGQHDPHAMEFVRTNKLTSLRGRGVMRTMTRTLLILFALLALPAGAPAAVPAPGIYTNEEQVYFEGEAGRTPPPWTGVRIETAGEGFVWQTIDRFGVVLASATIAVAPDRWTFGGCTLAVERQTGNLRLVPMDKGCAARVVPDALDAEGMSVRLPDGQKTFLRRARPFVCWMTVRRDTARADGSEDWLLRADMKTHDQGGRLRLGGGDSGAPEAIIRIRNVVWPPPTRNRPSLVLYVLTPDDMDRAVAYGWADPGAVRIGINQRWMQASCTLASFSLDGAE